jgi:drug/metabolite transporter (DMT)-like permease
MKSNKGPVSLIKGYKPELILLSVSFYWGLTFPLIKLVLADISPMAFVFSRFVLTTAIFYILFRRDLSNFNRTAFRQGLILGVFLFVGFFTQTIGLKYTTASKSAFITGINIVLLPFAQILITKSKPNLGNILGVILVVIGLYFLTELQKTKINTGDLITLICAVAFAFQIVYLDKYSKNSNHIVLVYGQYISMVVLSLSAMLIFEIAIFKDFVFVLNFQSVFITIFTAIFSTLLALYLAMKYQRFVSPVRAGLIYNMEQVTAVIAAYFILTEIMSFSQITGAAIMTIGLIISEIFTKFNYVRDG